MEILADPFWGRLLLTLFLGMIAGVWFFGVDIFLLLTRRRFGHVNINVARFTRRDHKSSDNKLVYRTIDGNVPLREILRNRYLFWYIVWSSLKASLDEPVLEFESHTHGILSLFRVRAASKFAGMEMKRYAGMPYTSTPSWLCIVYDHSEDRKDKRSRILRVMIIPQEVFENFDEYRKEPPHNTENWRLMQKIYDAYKSGSGSFIDIEITAA